MTEEELKSLMELEKAQVLLEIEKLKTRFAYASLILSLVASLPLIRWFFKKEND